jgi:hypothetical protein
LFLLYLRFGAAISFCEISISLFFDPKDEGAIAAMLPRCGAGKRWQSGGYFIRCDSSTSAERRAGQMFSMEAPWQGGIISTSLNLRP